MLATVGQSNAGNNNSSKSATKSGDGVYVYYDGRCFIAKDPVPGAGGSGGSLWPDLGKRIASQTGKHVLFINGAVGTSQWGDWLDPRSGYLAAFEERLVSAGQAGFEPHLVIWHQGETDARTNISLESRQKNLEGLADEFLRLAPRAKLYVFRVSLCNKPNESGPSAEIVSMQASLAQRNPRIIVGMNTDTLGDDYRWDRCHFNSLGRSTINAAVENDLKPLLPMGNQVPAVQVAANTASAAELPS